MRKKKVEPVVEEPTPAPKPGADQQQLDRLAMAIKIARVANRCRAMRLVEYQESERGDGTAVLFFAVSDDEVIEIEKCLREYEKSFVSETQLSLAR